MILKIAGLLTVKGGTASVIEYFGDGAQSLSCTGMATMCNMGAEVGATTSIFPYNDGMARFLEATGRESIARHAERYQHILTSDAGCEYDKVLDIDLSTVEPYINGPFTPDLATPISEFAAKVKREAWPCAIKVGLVGSCTNSSYEDLTRAASIAREATLHGAKSTAQFMVTPGSEQIRATVERDGVMEDLRGIGAEILANACGPCTGQWDRRDVQMGEMNSSES